MELQFNMEKEADLLQFIDENGTTRAGFIKSVVRQYMNAMQSVGQQNIVQQSAEKDKFKGRKQSKQLPPNEDKKEKKKVPKLGASFSSNDFD